MKFHRENKYRMSLTKDIVDEVLNLDPDTLPDESDDDVDSKIIVLFPCKTF